MKTHTSSQDITDSILRDTEFSTNQADMYANPIHQTHMEGSFFRNLLRTKRFKWLRIGFAFVYFIFPVLLGSMWFALEAPQIMRDSVTVFLLISISLFLMLYLLAGIRILFPRD